MVDGSSEKSLKASFRTAVSSGSHSFLLEVLDFVDGSSKSSSQLVTLAWVVCSVWGWSHLGTFILGSIVYKIHNLLHPIFGIGENKEIGVRTKSFLHFAQGDIGSTLDLFGKC